MTVPTLHMQGDSLTLLHWETSPVTSHSIQSKGQSLTTAFSYTALPADPPNTSWSSHPLTFHFLFFKHSSCKDSCVSCLCVSLQMSAYQRKPPLGSAQCRIAAPPISLPVPALFFGFKSILLFIISLSIMVALGCCRSWTFSSCGARASHRSGLSWWAAQTLGCTDFSGCGSWASEHRLGSYDALA